MLLFAAALAATFLSGWLRHHLLTAASGSLVGLPWLPLRRAVLGLLFDLPAGVVTVVVCVIAHRLIVLKPLPTVVALAATVWLIDLLMAWLVAGDMRLWTDPLIVAARAVVLVGSVVVGARALGWRVGRARMRNREPGAGNEE